MKGSLERDEFIRRRVERQRKLRKRRLTVFFIFLIITLLCIGTALSLTVFFPIESLTASGSAVYKSEQIIEVSGIKKGDNLFVISKSDVLDKLKSKLPYIETVELERQLPGSLKIKVTDADEYACVLSENKYYTVSKSGWVLKVSNAAVDNIFEIRGADVKCEVGSQLVFKREEDSELIDRISAAFKQNGIAINFIDISNEVDILIGADGRFTVSLGTSNYTEEKIKHLAGMIEKIPSESEGKINLSMWTTDNTSATFIKKTD